MLASLSSLTGSKYLNEPCTLTFPLSKYKHTKYISLGPTPCDPNPCLNSGTCYPGQGQDFICACTVEFTGDICEIRKHNICNHSYIKNVMFYQFS